MARLVRKPTQRPLLLLLMLSLLLLLSEFVVCRPQSSGSPPPPGFPQSAPPMSQVPPIPFNVRLTISGTDNSTSDQVVFDSEFNSSIAIARVSSTFNVSHRADGLLSSANLRGDTHLYNLLNVTMVPRPLVRAFYGINGLSNNTDEAVRAAVTIASAFDVPLLVLFHNSSSDNSDVIRGSRGLSVDPIPWDSPVPTSPTSPYLYPLFPLTSPWGRIAYNTTAQLYPNLNGPEDGASYTLFRMAFDANLVYQQPTVVIIGTQVAKNLARYLYAAPMSTNPATVQFDVILSGIIPDPIGSGDGSGGFGAPSPTRVIVSVIGGVLLLLISGLIGYYHWYNRPFDRKEHYVVQTLVEQLLAEYQIRQRQARAARPAPVTNPARFTAVELNADNIAAICDRNATRDVANDKEQKVQITVDDVDDIDLDDDDDDDGHYGTQDVLVRARAIANRDHPLRADNNNTGNNTSDEACSICLEQFAIGDMVRVLNCRHVFHTACIDPWLSTASALCPLCKTDNRTAAEIEHYLMQCEAAAESNRTVLAHFLEEQFNARIDTVSDQLIGRVIKRRKPLCILVLRESTMRRISQFTTSIFIRTGASAGTGTADQYSRLAGRHDVHHVFIPRFNGTPMVAPPTATAAVTATATAADMRINSPFNNAATMMGNTFPAARPAVTMYPPS